MKILIINAYDTYGGAARAANRLHKGLLNHGIDSLMIVQKKFSIDSTIYQCPDNWNGKNGSIDKIPLYNYPERSKNLFSINGLSNLTLVNYINNSDADIVHLHWITNGFFKTEELNLINKPIVWTLHDMWPFTGGCHYSEDCKEYTKTCENCKVINNKDKNNLSSLIFRKKHTTYSQLETLKIIGVSSWVSKCAQESTLLKNKPITTLPNMLDTSFFDKKNKKKSRKIFNLPANKKLVLFGAINSISDKRKGFKELSLALSKLHNEDIELVIFGTNNKEFKLDNIPTHNIGDINDDSLLIKLYSAADVMIVPSIQEVFGQTAIEAMACYTPVVAFKTSGLIDIINHKENGYLAQLNDSTDLAEGIKWIINNKNYLNLSKNAREKVVNSFSEKVVVPKYIQYYNSILNHTNSQTIKEKNTPDSMLDQYTKGFHHYLNSEKNSLFSISFNKFYKKILSIRQTNEKIVLYGNGTIGKTIKTLLPQNVIGYVDINDNKYHPRSLKKVSFDYVMITVLGREEEIKKYLLEELNINPKKIITFEL